MTRREEETKEVGTSALSEFGITAQILPLYRGSSKRGFDYDTDMFSAGPGRSQDRGRALYVKVTEVFFSRMLTTGGMHT